MYDVQKEHYTTVIREMIRHENDVTNHRIMRLLIGQGFIANAYVSAERKGACPDYLIPVVGILITLSACLKARKTHKKSLQFGGISFNRNVFFTH
jgi:hypothetical protein